MENEQNSLMRQQTHIQRANGSMLTCDPQPGREEHPSGYTCWGPETGSCRTLHITRVNALKCIEKTQRVTDTRRSSRDFQDRRPVALYCQPRGEG